MRLGALRAPRRHVHEFVEATFEFGRIGLQGSVLELRAPAPDGASLLQQAAQSKREDAVARLDGEGRPADEMGLMPMSA